jgi:hypothetical protein
MQNCSKLGHSRYKESGQEKAAEIWETDLAIGKVTPQKYFLCKISVKTGLTKGIVCSSWSSGLHILSN